MHCCVVHIPFPSDRKVDGALNRAVLIPARHSTVWILKPNQGSRGCAPHLPQKGSLTCMD